MPLHGVCGDGAASYLSICAGRKDSDSAHKCTLIISIILAVICEIFAVPLMRLFGTSSQTLAMAVEYFQIVAAFFPFYLLLNVMNSMIRADGSPAYAMVAMLAGAIINIILDPVFIFLLKWGIAGAAWATVIGQVASFLACVCYFFKPKTFRLSKRSFVPDKAILRNTISLGAATFVTQISIVVLSLVCNMTLAHYGELSKYGPDVPISVFSIQTKVYTVVCNIVTGIVLGDSRSLAITMVPKEWIVSGRHTNWCCCLTFWRAPMLVQESMEFYLQRPWQND